MSDHLDLVLRLLDHQIVGRDGELLGNVDDVELTPATESLAVTGVAVGPAALAQRLPGLLGTWTDAVWRRLSRDADPQPVVVPIGHIADVSSAVRVDEEATRGLAFSAGLERWLRDHVISRIPGATDIGDPDHDDEIGDQATSETEESGGGTAANSSPPRRDTGPPVRAPHPGARWLSSLLGAEVRDDQGRAIGRLIEVHCETGDAPWAITHLQCTRSALGTELGYHAHPHQGPALIGRVVRHWQRHDVLVAVGDITQVEADPARIVVTAKDDRQHPHAGETRTREPRRRPADPGGTRDG